MKLNLVNSSKLPDHCVCLCLLTSWALCNFEMNIATLLLLTIKMNICLMVKAKIDTTMQLCSCSSLTKRCEGSVFQRASLLNSFNLSIIINVSITINSKINFLNCSTFFYQKSKLMKQILLPNYIFDKRFQSQSYKT